MEKHNLARNNGVLGLPPGFRFHPTDQELVAQYLLRKVLSFPVPASIIPELDACTSNPWDLAGDREQERYFFSNGNRSNRATESGYWKATGPEKRIACYTKQRHGNVAAVGMKRTLVFYMGKPGKASRTDWVMHEFRLANTAGQVIIPVPVHVICNKALLDHLQESWVLCRIFLKARNKIKSNSKSDNFTMSSSDASSGITTTDDYHELSSSANSF